MKKIKTNHNNCQMIAEQLAGRDNFLLVGHVIPDGDCIGSIAALQMGLEALGKKAAVLLPDRIPAIYEFLPATAGFNCQWPNDMLPDNIVYVDCSDNMRVGEVIAGRINTKTTSFNIDHHATNDDFADYNWVEPAAAAAAELIWELLNALGVNIDADMATALYSGLIMDTGRFMYKSTSDKTLLAASQLLKAGADLERIRINLFENQSRQEIMLRRLALNNLAVSADGRMAWISLPYKKVAAIGALDFHPEGIIDYTRSISGVEVGILFREMEPGRIKVGFRSKGNIDVAAIAAQIGGGGHRQAAGAVYSGTLAQARKTVINLVKDVLV